MAQTEDRIGKRMVLRSEYLDGVTLTAWLTKQDDLPGTVLGRLEERIYRTMDENGKVHVRVGRKA